jgi:hypothetical protein
MAAQIIYGAKGTKDITSTSTVSSNVTSDIKGTKANIEEQKADTSAKQVEEASLKDARAELAKLKKSRIPTNQKKWQDLVKEHGSEEAAGEAYIKNYMVKPAAPAAAPAAKPAAAPAPAQSGKVMSRADVAATAKARGVTEADVIAAAKKAGYTIK